MKLDMHIHSGYSFDCTLELEDIIRAAKAKGLDGIAITDHGTIEGAMKAKGMDPDFIVVGEEVLTDRGEVIGYHLSEAIKSKDFFEVIDEIKSQGGKVSIPHPFDMIRRGPVRDKGLIREAKGKIDYLEVNGRTLPLFNNQARKFAQKEGIGLIGGSDSHLLREIGNIYTEFNEKTLAVGNGSYLSIVQMVETKLYKIFRA